MTTFSKLVSEAERKGAIKGSRAISRAAKGKGYSLSHGTVSKVLNGTHGNVSDQTIAGLAAVLPVTTRKMYEALGVEPAETYEPPPAADRLTAVQRDLINALIHQLVRPDGGPEHGKRSAKKMTDEVEDGEVNP